MPRGVRFRLGGFLSGAFLPRYVKRNARLVPRIRLVAHRSEIADLDGRTVPVLTRAGIFARNANRLLSLARRTLNHAKEAS